MLFMGLLWLWASEVAPHSPVPLEGPPFNCILHWVKNQQTLWLEPQRSLVWKGFDLDSWAGWGIYKAQATIGRESVQHWVEEVQGPGHAGSLAVSPRTEPPFWRLPRAPTSSWGAEEGTVRDVAHVLRGPCGLLVAGKSGFRFF